jgi:hypothetical protein
MVCVLALAQAASLPCRPPPGDADSLPLPPLAVTRGGSGGLAAEAVFFI